MDDETGVVGLSTGSLEFSTAKYTVTTEEGGDVLRAANAGSYPGARITVVRKGGNRGRIQVDFSTGNGSAWAYTNYLPFTNFTLTFDDYEMSKSLTVQTLEYKQFPEDLRYNLSLSCWATNESGGGFTNLCEGATNPAPGRVWPFTPIYFKSLAAECSNLVFAAKITTNGIIGGIMSATWEVPLILSNPRLDPDENRSLPAPTLGAQATAGIGIVFVDDLKDVDGTILPQRTGHAFERIHYRAPEGSGGSLRPLPDHGD